MIYRTMYGTTRRVRVWKKWLRRLDRAKRIYAKQMRGWHHRPGLERLLAACFVANPTGAKFFLKAWDEVLQEARYEEIKTGW